MSLCLHEFEHTTIYRLIYVERLLKVLERDAHSGPRKLHPAVCRGVNWTDQVKASNEAFSSHHPYFGGGTLRGNSENGR